MNPVLEKAINERTPETFGELHTFFQGLLDKIKKLDGLKQLPLLPILWKSSYYQLLFTLSKTGDKESQDILFKGLKEDLIFIEHTLSCAEVIGAKVDKIKNGKNTLITKKNEIIIFTKSEDFGYYVIYVSGEHLKVYNLTNPKNGYHIFDSGNFCSGNTYETLKGVLERTGDVPLFISFLKKVLTAYDDGAHHTATPSQFEPWKEIYKHMKKGYLTLKERRSLIKVLHEKQKVIENTLLEENYVTKEAKTFILDKIDEFEHFIRSFQIKKEKGTKENSI